MITYIKFVFLSSLALVIIYALYSLNTLQSDLFIQGWQNTESGVTGKLTGKEQNSEWEDLLKCQKLRIHRLQTRCKELGLLPTTSLEYLSPEQLKKLTYKFLTDDIHHVILKAIPKTGCTSWKLILLNNTMHLKPWQPNLPGPHNWNGMRLKSGLYSLRDYNKEAILSRLKSYLTILTTRHPLTRLESAFKEKRLDQHRFRTDIKENKEKFFNSTISVKFQQWLEMVKIVKPRWKGENIHWESIVEHAHPCIIPYNYIAKTETADTEMRYVIKEKLDGVGGPVQENTSSKLREDKMTDNGDRLLTLFSKLNNPHRAIKELMDVYGLDMKLFGYSYEIRADGVYSTCENYEFNGMCC